MGNTAVLPILVVSYRLSVDGYQLSVVAEN